MSADLVHLRAELAQMEAEIAEQSRASSPSGGRVDDLLAHRASVLRGKIAEAAQASATTEPRGGADATVPERTTEPSPSGDTTAALDFLERWRPGGPWVVTAISTDKKSIETTTFDATTLDQLAAWIERHNGVRNIYFMVNPATRALTKKADREDVAALAWLHVDVDPRAGEDIAAEQERALRLLREPPGSIPPPTVFVFSGGGYQGFWKLREPLAIDGDVAKAERAKLYNLQLEHAFGGDHCHNVDRIMRLPGTINVPDKVKLKKGRVPALARLVEWHDDRVYPIGAFTPATEARPSGATVDAREITRSPKLADTNELDRWGVPDRVKVIVAQGDNRALEGSKPEDDSRSAWLFDALCNMARCDVPDEVLLSILLDEGFGISVSILDKKNPEKYALRQIAQAKEHAIDPRLRDFNARFAIIGNIGGRCRVVEEQEEIIDAASGVRRSRLTLQSFPDFKNRFPLKIQVGSTEKGRPIMTSEGTWWLEHPNRRYYDRIVFHPGREVEDAYNLWRGFAFESRPGDCSLFLAHVRENVCAGDERLYDYLIGWMALMVQQPASQGHVAVVLRGGRGTGKSFFATQVGALLGRHFLHVADPKFLVGSFNAHLRNCLLLLADEAFFAGDKRHAGVLKALITERLWMYEMKGVDAEPGPNYVHLILCSNERWVVPAGADERRFLVLDVAEHHQQDHAYFKAIDAQMRAGGYEALLHLLMTLDLSNFNVRAVPATEALDDQKELSALGPVEATWLDCLRTGVLPWHTQQGRHYLVATEDFRDYAREQTGRRDVSVNAVAGFLGRPPLRSRGRVPHMGFEPLRNSRYPSGYLIPADLALARRWWCERMNLRSDWGEDANEWRRSEWEPRRRAGAHLASYREGGETEDGGESKLPF